MGGDPRRVGVGWGTEAFKVPWLIRYLGANVFLHYCFLHQLLAHTVVMLILQGVLAYFYDIIYPGHAVELDVCRWNQVVADVIWRGPNRMEHLGQCRQYPVSGDFDNNRPENGQCEDCRTLPVEETYTVHYTACAKPWECRIPHPRVPRNPKQAYRLRELTNVTTCGLLFRKYFDFRKDIEDRMAKVIGMSPSQRNGKFQPEQFLGYCKRSGGYESINIPDDLDLKQIYGF